jgi:serine/threonine protein kinase
MDKIGSGVYGTVFRAKDTDSGSFVAIKRPVISSHYADQGLSVSMIREASLLKSFKSQQHDNILKLKDFFVLHSRIYLVFDIWHCNLRNHIADVYYDEEDTLEPETLKSFMHQIMSALAYCHERRVIHRDMKPDNILLDARRENLVLCDFGMARTFAPGKSYTNECVSVWYRPPEILLGDLRYETSVDIWSAGMIMAEMINLSPVLSSTDSEIECISYLFEYLGTPNEETWPGVTSLPHFELDFKHWPFGSAASFLQVDNVSPLAIDLLDQLLQLCPTRRLTASKVLKEHAYFLPELSAITTSSHGDDSVESGVSSDSSQQGSDFSGSSSGSCCSASRSQSSSGKWSSVDLVRDPGIVPPSTRRNSEFQFDFKEEISDQHAAEYIYENSASNEIIHRSNVHSFASETNIPSWAGSEFAEEPNITANSNNQIKGSGKRRRREFNFESAENFPEAADEFPDQSGFVNTAFGNSSPNSVFDDVGPDCMECREFEADHESFMPNRIQSSPRVSQRRRTELVHNRLSRRDVTSSFFD